METRQINAAVIAGAENLENVHSLQTDTGISEDAELSKVHPKISETIETRQADADTVVAAENPENNHVLQTLTEISDCADVGSQTAPTIKNLHDDCRKRRECDNSPLLPLPMRTVLKQSYLQALA
jgi:hypothetical protein